ncbi:probable F420-dependent oxidoreductase, MSMEG_2249 family [Parafrankia irregularis]|uniref:Probable F420-dependent oxidoreductase, MSMEG_2249 family n=1 Tax=Parafrankia irregularis TaxID=795642 RepID=A0A0S4QNY1_9ACTN|nr:MULTISPECIES: TIGR03857 family LLM class F420-dependent oxidoreductase [Parafrankia]MBE3201605.1 TIGR03857 family LLM class F420-dependent oxidoreductase [Parafrankia sp. CH37]CUU57345.1 probable F420-dependent oxidoreductase, MSMEG_2249 family [Parafrankia irregularis]
MTTQTTQATDQLSELGFYTLAGHSGSPRDLVDEVRKAEELGLGAAFISERFSTKDAATLSGAAGAVSDKIGIATAATNHNTRHPIVTATMATTMHRLTGGRFALGLGRGFDGLFKALGLAPITGAQIEDVVGLLRRLWKGEMVLGHDGPAGKFPYLHQDRDFDEDIPILIAALGTRTLELAGRCLDAVVLHTFYSDAAVTEALAAVARGAKSVGRDPAEVRVWSVLATVSDEIPEDRRLLKTIGRLASYLQGYGDLMVRVNDWDPAVLERFRADTFVRGFKGAFDAKATTAELEHLATLIPAEWIATSATGSPRQCADAVARQFDLGVTGVIMHGATPTELTSVVDAYRDIRPAAVRDLPANPGRVA